MGSSLPLKAIASDGGEYWVKQIDNPLSHMVPINEQVVGRCGALIGAPTCPVELIRIPAARAGLVSGVRVSEGIGHASRHIANTREWCELVHRDDDDNRRRHAGILALTSWCWGGVDLQWLYDDATGMTFSHDHGSFFPGGPDWHEYTGALDWYLQRPYTSSRLRMESFDFGLDPGALKSFAEALDSVTAADIAQVLRAVPQQWPIEVCHLAALGHFLEHRAPYVADYLRDVAARS